MIKAFIFDMDGVIIDSEPIHLEIDLETAKHFGIGLTKEEIDQYVGMTNPEMWGIIKKKYNLSPPAEEIVNVQMEKKLKLMDTLDIDPISGIPELLEELRSHRITVGLASSSPMVFIEKVLEKFGIRHYFSCVISGEEMARGKPAPDIYLEASKVLDIPPEQCMVLEDSRNGVMAAKSAGMRCIGFANPNSGSQDLSAADVVVKSIHDIKVEELS